MRFVLLRFVPLLLLGSLWLDGPVVAQTQEAKLTASDGEPNQRFGRAVDLSADGATVLVGGHQDEIGGADPPSGQDFPEGSAYVFVRDDSGTWTEEAKLTASDATGGDAFGQAVSLSADGTIALVGAQGDDFSRGSAYVFTRGSNGTWSQQAKLIASDGADGDSFGNSVSLSADGTVALVGAIFASINGEQMGSAYVFAADGAGNWTQQAKLVGSDLTGEGFGGEKFGQSVALDENGSTALVGANEDPIEGNDEQGSAFVFTNDGSGNWTEQTKLTASDGSQEDQFGWAGSLSADGSTALVGTFDQLADGDQGGVYVYSRDASGVWTEQTKLTPPDGAGEDRFGNAVSINSDASAILAGARQGAGSAYLFPRNTDGSWAEPAKLTASDGDTGDFFGISVSLDESGSRALVGASQHEVEGQAKEGSAYIFGLPAATAPTATTEPATNITETTARLNGTVNPNGAETTVNFVYYPTGQPGQGQTITADQSPLTGTSTQDVSATAEFLQGDTEYTFLVSAENSGGLTNGSEITFTTGTDAVDIAIVETIGVNDAPKVTPPITISIAESIGVSDVPAVTPAVRISVTETIAVTDAPKVTQPLTISIAESIGVSDAPAVTPAVRISVTETIGVADAPRVTPPLTISIAESIGVSDAPAFAPAVRINVTETIGVTDAPKVTPPITISIAESIGVSDAPAVAPAVSINVTESIGVTDAPNVSPIIAIETSTVGSNGPVDFGATGVMINFASVDGSGEVTVTKFGDAPNGTDGIFLPNISQFRYTIETGGALSVGPGTEVGFDVGTIDGMSDPDETTIFKRPTTGTGSFSALSTTFDASSNALVATTESFSEFALASDENPLPVELATFNARLDGETVHLSWRTASETKNAGFEIERRTEAGKPETADTWEQIGFVEGTGTTTESQHYQFEDADLPYAAEALTYRLKQIDTDGSFDYSETVEVALNAPDRVILRAPFPNPVTEQTTVRYALPQTAPVNLAIYNALGQRVATLVDSEQDAGRQQIRFDARGLSNGVYFLRLTSDGTTRTRKLTVVR